MPYNSIEYLLFLILYNLKIMLILFGRKYEQKAQRWFKGYEMPKKFEQVNLKDITSS
jgi:hypothetical protein